VAWQQSADKFGFELALAELLATTRTVETDLLAFDFARIGGCGLAAIC